MLRLIAELRPPTDYVGQREGVRLVTRSTPVHGKGGLDGGDQDIVWRSARGRPASTSGHRPQWATWACQKGLVESGWDVVGGYLGNAGQV